MADKKEPPNSNEEAANETGKVAVSPPKKTCGIVMPISAQDNCSAEHWADVLRILHEAIELAGFRPNLVSNADDVGIIQKTIVENLYDNEIVVCDVSGKNPNVMFELGMRLAFDKPTIIVKDDKTDYSFDTSVITHLGYPRDLRFATIVAFKEELAKKIQATYKKSIDDPNQSTFLKSFGQFVVARLQKKEVTSEEFLAETVLELKRSIDKLMRNGINQGQRFVVAESSQFPIPVLNVRQMPSMVLAESIDRIALIYMSENAISDKSQIRVSELLIRLIDELKSEFNLTNFDVRDMRHLEDLVQSFIKDWK